MILAFIQAREQMLTVVALYYDHGQVHGCSSVECPVAGALLEAAQQLRLASVLPSPDPRAYSDARSPL